MNPKSKSLFFYRCFVLSVFANKPRPNFCGSVFRFTKNNRGRKMDSMLAGSVFPCPFRLTAPTRNEYICIDTPFRMATADISPQHTARSISSMTAPEYKVYGNVFYKGIITVSYSLRGCTWFAVCIRRIKHIRYYIRYFHSE